jgi:hypothetical protein
VFETECSLPSFICVKLRKDVVSHICGRSSIFPHTRKSNIFPINVVSSFKSSNERLFNLDFFNYSING